MPSLCVKQDRVIAADAAESTLKQCLTVVEKKVRNLEKRKTKLDSYQTKQTEGAELNQDQKDAIAKSDVVQQNLEFARDLQKQFQSMLAESEKMLRKQAKREKMERQQHEVSRLRMLLRLDTVLARLSKDSVKSDFLTGKHGALVLSEECVEQFCGLGKLMKPCDDLSDIKRLDEACEHIVSFLDAKDSLVVGTTYKQLYETFESIINCGYFSSMVPHSGESIIGSMSPCDKVKVTEELIDSFAECRVNGKDMPVGEDELPVKSLPNSSPSSSPSSLSTISHISHSASPALAADDVPLPTASCTDPLPIASCSDITCDDDVSMVSSSVNTHIPAATETAVSVTPSVSVAPAASVPTTASTALVDAHHKSTTTSDCNGEFSSSASSRSVSTTSFLFETSTSSCIGVGQSPTDSLYYPRPKDPREIVSSLLCDFNFLQDSELDADQRAYNKDFVCVTRRDTVCNNQVPDETASSISYNTPAQSVESVTTAAANEVPQFTTHDLEGHQHAVSHSSQLITFTGEYLTAQPMMTTMPYVTPLVTDPYLVHSLGYGHQVAYTTAYGAVMPAYSQPMISSNGHELTNGMPSMHLSGTPPAEDDLACTLPIDTYSGGQAVEAEFEASAADYEVSQVYHTNDLDHHCGSGGSSIVYTPVDEIKQQDVNTLNPSAPEYHFQPVQCIYNPQSTYQGEFYHRHEGAAFSLCHQEQTLQQTLNPNAHEFRSRYADTPPPQVLAACATPTDELSTTAEYNEEAVMEDFSSGYHHAGVRGGRSGWRGGQRGAAYYNYRGNNGFNPPRYHRSNNSNNSSYQSRQEGSSYNNGHHDTTDDSHYSGSTTCRPPPRRGGRGSRGSVNNSHSGRGFYRNPYNTHDSTNADHHDLAN